MTSIYVLLLENYIISIIAGLISTPPILVNIFDLPILDNNIDNTGNIGDP